jgi:hypothetical protein
VVVAAEVNSSIDILGRSLKQLSIATDFKDPTSPRGLVPSD